MTASTVFPVSVSGLLYILYTKNLVHAALVGLMLMYGIWMAAVSAALVAAILSLFRVFYYLFKMASCLNPEVGLYAWKLGFSPFSALFRPNFLNEDGLLARKQVMVNMATFLSAAVAAAALAWILQLTLSFTFELQF